MDSAAIPSSKHRSNRKASKKKRKKEAKEAKRRSSHHKKVQSNDDALASDSFFIDRSGDISNALYGCIRDTPIPLYRRSINRILGCSRDWRVGIDNSRGRSSTFVFRQAARHSFDSSFLGKSYYAQLRVSLRAPAIKMHTRRTDKASIAANTLPDFVNLSPFTDQGDHNEKMDTSPDNSIAMKELEQDISFVEKSKAADQLVRQNPTNAGYWIAFAKVQDDLLLQVPKSRLGSMTLSITEKKMAIFEKALDALPGNEELVVHYMNCCAEIWDMPTLLTKWDQILEEFPTSPMLWSHYIDFRQTRMSPFSVTGCIEVLEESIQLLRMRSSQGKRITSAKKIDTHAAPPAILMSCFG
eukprot:jgi/Hompol1/6536/HPOL_000189-RA